MELKIIDVDLFAKLYGYYLLETFTRTNYPIHYFQYDRKQEKRYSY